jgi:hypothetical protein
MWTSRSCPPTSPAIPAGARVEQEARAVAALNHPNILGLYDIGNEAGVLYRHRIRGQRNPRRPVALVALTGRARERCGKLGWRDVRVGCAKSSGELQKARSELRGCVIGVL